MPQVPADKSYFTFSKGLHTEASELNYPEETTIDEENFELLIDGSRKRRRGLDTESGGSAYTLPTALGTSDVVHSARWRNVGGNPEKNFIVVQSGKDISFFDDATTLSTGADSATISIEPYQVSGTSAQLKATPVDFTFGRGHLFVAGKYIDPFYVTWDSVDGFTIKKITIQERDFEGVEDNVGPTVEPATLTTAHEYNLKNRGWKDADISQYNTDKSKYPSKNKVWYEGYRRLTVTSYAEEDGTLEWSSDKLEATIPGNSSFQQGALIRNPFDTQYATNIGGGVLIEAAANNTTLPAQNIQIDLTVTGHGYTNGTDTIQISGSEFNANLFTGFDSYFTTLTYDGTWELVASPSYGASQGTVVDADTIRLYYQSPGTLISFGTPSPLGQIGEGDIIERPTTGAGSEGTYTVDVRPEAIQWFAGRVFFAGIADPNINDHIFFSQLVIRDEQYGMCYQEHDPTSEDLNTLESSDGGVIVVPELGKVQRMEPLGSSLIIFSDNGIWEIGGGQRGFFTADGYSVRKLSEVEATSPYGVASIEDSIVFTSSRGLYTVFWDIETRSLTVRSMSAQSVQTLWNQVSSTAQERTKVIYDGSRKRVYFLYQSDTSTLDANIYDVALVYDVRLGAYYKLTFPAASQSGISSFVSIKDADSSESNKKIKWFVISNSGADLDICDLDQSDYVDFDGNEKVPYLVTGYDNVGDWMRFRQAPYIHVFMKKTETGYTTSGTDLVPINPSSLTMQSRFDWADNSNSGKYGTSQQVYRHKRYYQPASSSDTFDDGQPVIVTRNKVRGRGRSLHLYFEGAETYDAHLLGWNIHYLGDPRI